MKSLISLRRASGLALIAAAWAGTAGADDTANMTVTANVAPSCQLTTVDTLGFGTLDPTSDNDAQADITWVCTSGFNTTIELDGGSSGDLTARTMGGSGILPYQLFRDAARTEVFGDGSAGSFTTPVSGTGYGNPDTVTVYGRVDQADAAAAVAGNYLDTVGVTIVF